MRGRLTSNDGNPLFEHHAIEPAYMRLTYLAAATGRDVPRLGPLLEDRRWAACARYANRMNR